MRGVARQLVVSPVGVAAGSIGAPVAAPADSAGSTSVELAPHVFGPKLVVAEEDASGGGVETRAQERAELVSPEAIAARRESRTRFASLGTTAAATTRSRPRPRKS
jgi:hypothetical protein